MLCPPRMRQKRLRPPGRSGMVTGQQRLAAFALDLGAFGDIAQAVEVDVGAGGDGGKRSIPQLVAFDVCLEAGIGERPAGSRMNAGLRRRLLMAAEISSLLTTTMSSTKRRHRRNVSWPTWRTATPSAKMPTCARRTRLPLFSERSMASASSGSTPMIFTSAGLQPHVHGHAGDEPAAADRHEHGVERAGVLSPGSQARPCPDRRSPQDRRRDG